MHPDLIKLFAEDPTAGPRPRYIKAVRKETQNMERRSNPKTTRTRGGKRAKLTRERQLNKEIAECAAGEEKDQATAEITRINAEQRKVEKRKKTTDHKIQFLFEKIIKNIEENLNAIDQN